MKTVLGVLVILAGIALGVYVGLWLMLVGGIIQGVHALQAEPVDAGGVAWGAVRVVFAGPAAGLAVWLVAVVGMMIIGDGRSSRRRPGLTAKQVERDFFGNFHR